ncbi:hypothetical protein RHS01_06670 [Rhizoctonia solani]|uniref:Uncharacterized protein n=1 Tax=Rhizoctonia solani TaxID=456999 RepID=A0A8H7M0J4_9AGAM|nr:hypothetical protein RHS01_06670 [Rhizoctonia solani]
MSHMRRLPGTPSSTSSSSRSRTSFGGPVAEQPTARSSLGLSAPRPRSSLSMIERPVSLGGRGLEQSASGMARPSPLSSSRPLPPGRSTSGGKRAGGTNSPIPFAELSESGEILGQSEALEGALRREVEEKEDLMMRLASRDEAISQLESRIAALDVNMIQGEARLSELYADQERWEAERAALEKEIAKKTTVIDKLRIQLRELEKENRECTRRLTEQAAQFESERQAFYDNTTHLKSRIQSLTDQQREWKERLREEEEQELKDEAAAAAAAIEAEPEAIPEPGTPVVDSPVVPTRKRHFHQRLRSSIDRDATEPPEMTALRLELSTLTTSHGSLGETVRMLQNQLGDLERLNLTLQEENEAYTTLLREKTLSGQMNIMARAESRPASPTHSNEEQQPEPELKEEPEEDGSKSSGLLSPGQSPPPACARTREHPDPIALHLLSGVSRVPRARAAPLRRWPLRLWPICLSRALVWILPPSLGELKFVWRIDMGQPGEVKEPEAPKEDEGLKAMRSELEALKSEIKTLKDENKGLTLYASKIIDRIIAQEGFEHILAVDYRKPSEQKPPAPAPTPAPRKSLFQRAASLSISGSAPPVISTRPSLKIATDTSVHGAPGPDSPATPMGKREKRGISMDWSRLNPFGPKGPSTPVDDVRTTGLKPLTLGKTPSVKEEEPHVIVGGRKLDNQEDEDDRVERERLNAEMRLMGIERTPNIHTPSATSFAAAGQALGEPISRSNSNTPSLGGMVGWVKRPNSAPKQPISKRVPTGELLAEHLELLSDEGHSPHSMDYESREIENRMAALAEKEKHLSAEMAKGKGGGFTEPPPRGTRVRRRTGSTSGSTATWFIQLLACNHDDEQRWVLCAGHTPILCQDETQLDVQPGRLVAVRRVEPSGWAGVVDVEGGKGWIPFRYVRPIDDETVGVLEPIAQQLRLGAYRAITTIRATATNHLEGTLHPIPTNLTLWETSGRISPSNGAATRPRDMDSSKMGSNGTPRVSLDEDVPVPTYTPTTSGEKSPGVQFAAASPPTSFVPSRVRAFKLRSRSKSRDGVRSDSESVSRPRRPSVSIRRTRVSMFGSPREPNPVEQIRRLDARPWYLKPVHLPATGEIVLDSDGSVRAGTLEAIVERLTCEAPSRNQEIMLRRDVLFTYEAFTTSQQLFELITDQYSLEPPRELDESQFLDWKENKLRPTQARVLDVLGAWLDLPRLCQDGPDLIPRMREFLQFVTKPESLASEARRHLRTIEQLIAPPAPRSPTPQRRRRRSEKQRPFPTLSSHQTAPAPLSIIFGTESTSPSRGFTSPIQRSTSPRSGFNSPISRAASPILNNDEGLRPSSPLMLSTSMTSLPSAVTKQQKQQGELGSGLGRARSQRHASASYPRSESRQADLAYTALSERSHSSHGHSSHGHSSHGHSSHAHGSKHLPSAVNDIDPTALAHHLTLLESGLYMRIKRKQVLEWHKTSSSTEDSNATVNDLRNFCVTSDRLAGWVKWSVLSLGTSVRRAEAVGTWIRVAEKCRLLNNISSLAAIAAGLSSSDISRLPHTWHLVPSARAQRLEDLVLLTSPAGGFAQLKIFYSNVKFAVPFIGMYLTAIVHAADQFKDHLPFPVPADRSPRDEDGWATDGGHSEPVTPTQTQARSKSSRMSIGSPSPLSLNAVPPLSKPPTPTLSIAPSSPTTSTLGSQTKLINFAKRHKQAEIIHAMLKFQGHPYTVSSQSEPQGSTSSPYPTRPRLLPRQEQLSRAAILTLGTDWTYDRSLRLYDDETGGRTSGAVDKENMAAAGF